MRTSSINDTNSSDTQRSVYRDYPATVDSGDGDTPARRPRGRPKDPEVDAAIVRAAAETMVAVGFQRMTVPGVAAAAGVAKTTVYRRYPTTAELALVAISHLNASNPGPDTGSARDYLLLLL